MHKFLRTVGFSGYRKKKEIELLIKQLANRPSKTRVLQLDEETNLCEVKTEVAPGIGVAIYGEMDEQDEFHPEYYYPYIIGNNITSQALCSIQRHTEKETYAGLLEEFRVGVSLIFYLQNSMEYKDRHVINKKSVEVSSAMLAGLAVSGRIILPISKTKKQTELSKVITIDRSILIEAAKNGDEDAMESLTIEDIDLYSKISRRIQKEDIYTIVESCFMPCGIECDQYSILGEIKEMELLKNEITNEEIYKFNLDCNDMLFNVAINKKDLLGEPQVGRRFKGKIWMQGCVNFSK